MYGPSSLSIYATQIRFTDFQRKTAQCAENEKLFTPNPKYNVLTTHLLSRLGNICRRGGGMIIKTTSDRQVKCFPDTIGPI